MSGAVCRRLRQATSYSKLLQITCSDLMLAKIEEVWWKNRELQLQRSDEVTLVLSSLHVSLRVIPTMIFIHFLTGKSSGILSTNCFEMSWWGSLEVK